MKIACLDIGGTSIKRLCVDAEKGMRINDYEPLGFDSAPTRAAEGFEAIKSAIYESISTLIDTYGCEAIAISSAGNVDWDSGFITYATKTLPGFTGYDIVGDIKEKFHLPTRAINDAAAALVAEHYAGNHKKEREAMLTIGTGLGSALINGRALNASSIVDLNIGHYCYDEDGPLCTCGRRGCLELYASATALKKTSGTDDLEAVFNHYVTYHDAVESFIRAMVVAVKLAVDRGAQRIIVGGGVSQVSGWWGGFHCRFLCEISAMLRRAQLGNRAGALGAAYAALNGKFKKQ